MKDKFFTFDGPISEDELITMAKNAIAERILKSCVFSSPDTVRDFLILELSNKPMEVFYVLFLNSQHQLLGIEGMFNGTIDGAAVHPREVVRKSLEYNAAAVIFAHNHPSGHLEPSKSDVVITDRLKASLSLIDVRVLDHFIVGKDGVMSFAERGML